MRSPRPTPRFPTCAPGPSRGPRCLSPRQAAAPTSATRQSWIESRLQPSIVKMFRALGAESSVKGSGAIIPRGVAAQAPAFLSAVGIGTLIVLSRLLLRDVLGAQGPFVLAWPGIMVAAF